MFTTSGGVRIYYEIHGSSGPWLTLVHGGLVDSRSWHPVVGALAAEHRVLVYDVRGFGRSDVPPAGSYSLEASVADLRTLWAAAGVPSSIVVGFSQGGVIAQAAAVDCPGAVCGLVLVGTYARRSAEEIEGAANRAADAERNGISTQIEVHLDRVFSRQYRHEHAVDAARYIERLSTNDPQAFAATMRAMSQVDLTPHLPTLRAPTTVVVGAEDAAVGSAHAEVLASLIPGAELVIVPNCGHTVAMERPDIIVGIIRSLVARTAPTSKRERATAC